MVTFSVTFSSSLFLFYSSFFDFFLFADLTLLLPAAPVSASHESPYRLCSVSASLIQHACASLPVMQGLSWSIFIPCFFSFFFLIDNFSSEHKVTFCDRMSAREKQYDRNQSNPKKSNQIMEFCVPLCPL